MLCCLSHSIITFTRYSFCFSSSSTPLRNLCHFSIQPRQQVAVACCAVKTGCPRIGVCFPSFGILAGAIRFSIKSRACFSMTSKPFSSKYCLSFGESLNFRRKSDLLSLLNNSSYIILILYHFYILFTKN